VLSSSKASFLAASVVFGACTPTPPLRPAAVGQAARVADAGASEDRREGAQEEAIDAGELSVSAYRRLPVDAGSAQRLAAPFFVRRCGWVDNPTPANWWLTDRDGEWVIGVQGGDQAEGDLPDFGNDWVETNGHHGYGCACMEVVTDPRTKVVERVRDVRVLPIDRCRRDGHLSRR
jgi:hypothetical protein